MTFINAALLLGIFAFNIPLLIHLFNRSRFRVVKWGAMHLLQPVLRQNRRRLQLEQLILLLIRAAIPALLALCLARPLLTGWQKLAGDEAAGLVILLDNSYSMEAGGPGQTSFARARDEAQRLVRDLPRGSEVALVLLGGGAQPVTEQPTANTDRIVAELGRATAAYGMADTVGGFEAAAAALAKMKLPKRDVVLVSDFQKVNWRDDQAAARALRVEALTQDKLKPTLAFLRAGKEVTDNVAAESIELSRMVLGVKQKFNARASIRNYGQTAYPDLRVYFRVDGQERSVAQLALGAGEQGQVLFSHAFETPGSHAIEVFADAADAVVADNSVLASIPVWDRVPVLLVNGDPRPEPLQSETGYLEVALTPYHSARSTLADLIETRTIDPRSLDAAALGAARVVVLANVGQLAEEQAIALEAYLREGGSAIVFPGGKVNAAWYNARLFAEGTGLLPARLAGLGGSGGQAGASGAHAAIVAQRFDHPALELFNDPRFGNLGDSQLAISAWFKLEVRAALGSSAGSAPGSAPGRAGGAATGDQAAVLARLDTGDPFLVERKFGEGRVLLAAIPCDAKWSNLPARPVYLPLMQQLVTYAAAKVFPPRNVEVGQPLVALLAAADAGKSVTLTDPAGRKVELPVAARGSRGVVEYGQTRQPGLYVMQMPDGTLLHFVASTARQESDLAAFSDAEVRELAETMGATVVGSAAEFREVDQQRRFGREIWRWFYWGVLGLLFLELFLQQWFSRRKS